MKKIRFVISLVLTILAWLLILGGSIVSLKNFHNSINGTGPYYSITYLKTSLLISIFWSLLNSFWIVYNKKNFGSLNRRTFKSDVSTEELANYFEIDISEIERLQNDQYSFLEDTIIDYALLDNKAEKGQ